MDVRSGWTNVQSEMNLQLRMIRRMDAFDEYLIAPGGWMPKSDFDDIRPELFPGVNSPVIFNDQVSNRASYVNAQTHRRAIKRAPNYDGSTECGSRWNIPQIPNYPGCPNEPALYMEASLLSASGSPLDVLKITGGEGTLIRNVRISDVSSGSAAR